VQRNPFSSKEREVRTFLGMPFSIVECDIHGPIDDGDPNGFWYLAVFICVSKNAVFA
jgi:hypothetical protein